MHVSAIIAAGGQGRRLGADVPKQLLCVGGRPILQWTVGAFLACEQVSQVVVVAPPDIADDPPGYLRVPRVSVVAGGARRQDSVANGFDALPAGTDVVLVHDAARPFVDQATIARAIAAALESGAAIAAVGASDTIKLSEAGAPVADAPRFIQRTLARDAIFLAQTPQAFRRVVLQEAIALGRAGVEATDEAGLAEQAGHRVRLVEGSRRNIKITTREDLVIAEALLNQTEAQGTGYGAPAGDAAAAPVPSAVATGQATLRVGCGYDLHRLVEGRALILGGVLIPFDRGPAGHSDGDVLAHAITDAILGAVSMGDIGQHFPDTDPRWEGASSIDLLARVAAMARERHFEVANVDATVIVERPKLGPHRAAMIARLCEALHLPAGAVSVKAKTNEGVDAAGRGEAIAVHAVVLLQSRDR